MFENLDIFKMASGLAQHATSRQETIAKNIANADTPEYRAKDIASFSETYRGSGPKEMLRQTRPGHAFSGEQNELRFDMVETTDSSTPNGNSVSLETEMMKSVETRHQHDLALSVYKSSMNILRTSIGRR